MCSYTTMCPYVIAYILSEDEIDEEAEYLLIKAAEARRFVGRMDWCDGLLERRFARFRLLQALLLSCNSEALLSAVYNLVECFCFPSFPCLGVDVF